MRILIAGVGRSGTTALYRFFFTLLKNRGRKATFFYEPLFWKIRDIYPDESSFKFTDNISVVGLTAHLNSPLIADSSVPPDDFSRFLDALDEAPCEIWFAKCIRACGRLSWFLDRWPDLKIICIYRNPISVLNSVISRFSFFGEEYFPSDAPRFYGQLYDRGDVRISRVPSKAYIRALDWWKFMNMEIINLKHKYSDRIFILSQETLLLEPIIAYSKMLSFLDIMDEHAEIVSDGFKSGTAPNNLTKGMLDGALPYFDWYSEHLLPADECCPARDAQSLRERLILTHTDQRRPLADPTPRNLGPLALRRENVRLRASVMRLRNELQDTDLRLQEEVRRTYLGRLHVLLSALKRSLSK